MWDLFFEKYHISIYELSKKTGWSTTNNYKIGSEISFENACKIADALNISLDQLRKEVIKMNSIIKLPISLNALTTAVDEIMKKHGYVPTESTEGKTIK